MAKKPLRGGLEQSIEGFAEDLGRLLGTARARADNWLGQRQNIAKQLTDIRDTASDLLTRLGGAAAEGMRQARQQAASAASMGEATTSRIRKPGRPKGFKMSDAAKQKMREAWARRKAAAAAVVRRAKKR
jgi:hypothetical protein